jgi:hypothetical protein
MNLMLNLDVSQLIDAIKQLPNHYKLIILEELRTDLKKDNTLSFQQIFLEENKENVNDDSLIKDIKSILSDFPNS